MRRVVSHLSAGVAAGLGLYLVYLVTRYFLPPHVPRFRVETFFMWFLAAGALTVGLRGGAGPRDAPGSPGLGSVPELGTRPRTMLSALFAAVVLLQYGASLRVGWLSDDFVLADWAARREWIHAAETGFVRPIVPMIWGVASYAPVPWGWPVTLHAINLFLHALNGVLVVVIARRLRLERPAAVGAGLLFVTCSAMTEAIAWVSGMQDVLMATFGLVAVASVQSAGVDRGGAPAGPGFPGAPRYDVVAIGAAAFALGVKETAVAIPALAWAIAWATPGGIAAPGRRRTLAAMTAVAGAYAIFRALWDVSPPIGSNVNLYFFKQLAVDPFATLGAPWSAAWLAAHRAAALSRGIMLVGLLVLAFLTWRRDARFRIAVATAGWVFLAVLPVFAFFHVSATLEGSRYLYLPAAGFALFVAALIDDLARRARSPAVGSGIVAACVLALAVPSLAASRAELARWIEAARLRDSVLVAYVRVMPSVGCASFVAEGVVDNVDGAYVLRNGFRQALAEMGADVPAAGPACRIAWTDHIVVRVE